MTCYHPLKGYVVGTNLDTGKRKIVIKSWSDNDDLDYETVLVPCGKCLGCRIAYSRDWANRLILELQHHDSAYFVTLTYNDAHLPIVYYSDPATGEAYPAATLVKRDCQLFMKRLRKAVEPDHIRFFLAGEYGDQSNRPHYHAIIFGLHLDDLVWYKRVKTGKLFYDYYTSPLIDRCWSDDRGQIGFAVVGAVTYETCAYTTRYILKKIKGPNAVFYDDYNLVPPFTLMSRKPGLARLDYEELKRLESDPESILSHRYVIPSGDKVRKFGVPRYFRKLFELDFPDQYDIIKEHFRDLAEQRLAAELKQTNLDYLDYLQVKESDLSSRLKSLHRDL